MAIGLAKLQASDLENLDEKVAAYRHELGWSQQNLADEAGCSRPTIARLEAGNTTLSVTLIKVVEALNRGIENQGLLINEHGERKASEVTKKGARSERSTRRRDRSKRAREDVRGENTGSAPTAANNTPTEAVALVVAPAVTAPSAQAVSTSEPARAAHSGNHAGRNGEQIQRAMFSAPGA